MNCPHKKTGNGEEGSKGRKEVAILHFLFVGKKDRSVVTKKAKPSVCLLLIPFPVRETTGALGG